MDARARVCVLERQREREIVLNFVCISTIQHLSSPPCHLYCLLISIFLVFLSLTHFLTLTLTDTRPHRFRQLPVHLKFCQTCHLIFLNNMTHTLTCTHTHLRTHLHTYVYYCLFLCITYIMNYCLILFFQNYTYLYTSLKRDCSYPIYRYKTPAKVQKTTLVTSLLVVLFRGNNKSLLGKPQKNGRKYRSKAVYNHIGFNVSLIILHDIYFSYN